MRLVPPLSERELAKGRALCAPFVSEAKGLRSESGLEPRRKVEALPSPASPAFGLTAIESSSPLLQILSELIVQMEEANERLEEKVRRLYG